MNMICKVLIVSTALCLASPLSAREYEDNIPAILDRIEELESESDSAELVELLRCLSKPAEELITDDDLFFSEDALVKIEAATDACRLRVYTVLVPLSSSEDWLVAQEAAASLAYYGYTPAGQMLDRYPDGPLKAVLYAIVDYKSSYRWAIDRLLELQRKSQPGAGRGEAGRVYLGLLYHLAEPLSLPFLNQLISSDVEPEIRAHAELARKRILGLHPGLK